MTRAEQITKAVSDSGQLYRTLMRKAYDGTAAPRSAIKAQCLACVGFDRVSITHCTGFTCPLWTYRPYQIKGGGV